MNVGAKIFGSPSGEPKHHNQTNAQKKCEKLLTLPFTDDEVRRIIINAPEPLSTIIAVTAVLGLPIGETLALRKSDVDFTNTEDWMVQVKLEVLI